MGGGEGVDPSGLKHLGKASEITAYHEAGHAVACYVRKHVFEKVSIIQGEGFLGKLYANGIPKDFNIDNPGPAETQLAYDRFIISWAGFYSEYRFTGKYNWCGSVSDRFKANLFAPFLDRPAKECEEEAKKLIYSNWKKVKAVAQALLERHTLTAQQVQEICENQCG